MKNREQGHQIVSSELFARHLRDFRVADERITTPDTLRSSTIDIQKPPSSTSAVAIIGIIALAAILQLLTKH